MFTEKSQKSHQEFYCEKCDYTTSKKCDYDKHILTRKHINVDKCLPKSLKKYICSCQIVVLLLDLELQLYRKTWELVL